MSLRTLLRGILILLETGLQAGRIAKQAKGKIVFQSSFCWRLVYKRCFTRLKEEYFLGFNPHSVGDWFTSHRSPGGCDRRFLGFNPHSVGDWFTRNGHLAAKCWMSFCFNPHSVGDWFTSEKIFNCAAAGPRVSILILLETGLQVSFVDAAISGYHVSILILLETGLQEWAPSTRWWPIQSFQSSFCWRLVYKCLFLISLIMRYYSFNPHSVGDWFTRCRWHISNW